MVLFKSLVFKLYQKMNYAKLVFMISSYVFSTGNVPKPFMIPYPVSTHVKPCTNMEASTNSMRATPVVD